MTTTIASLEERMTALEMRIARLQQEGVNTQAEIPWWQKVWGTFKDDPDYEEAMRLGREYRQAQPLAYEEEADKEVAT